MGTVTKNLLVYLPSRDREVEIEVVCEYEIDNDGIGPYEYWGQVCYDKGVDHAVIVNIEWNTTGFTEEEINLVDAKIEKERDEWEEGIEVV